MHVSLSEDVPGIEPRAAARWWGDFQDGHADHRFLPGARRTILERGASHVTMREALGPLPWEVVTAWPGETEVRFLGKNRLATFEGSYRFEATPTGTRIVLDAEIRLRRGLGWSAFAAKPVAERILRVDLRGHAKELRQDIGPG